MAKNIEGASLVVMHNVAGSAPQLYVLCEVRMPASEYAAFVALAGLTSVIPAAAHADVTRQIAAGVSG